MLSVLIDLANCIDTRSVYERTDQSELHNYDVIMFRLGLGLGLV